ncbi:FAD-binding oxidoreductase [Flavobacteriaceae bacterium TP-CH-4]|uniref:FAD-binding oxidoreductase n=1 Tax=Pelagihabitans pacificus TaxID=2696054 RepID=A0A967AYR6_9FLAO|nr:FAD-dependent oxidoreductase [Pelagihabitans pacificus]NHF59021.1 FAD-binding oxidoreductase [Pelagihabitans pacificus]
MNLSYWEYKTWLSNVDFTVVGSGIVGLNCALRLKARFPKAKVLVLEKGILPQGASTKNAGFACFGSISEIIADLNHHSEQEVRELVRKRWDGIQLLRMNLGDSQIGFEQLGGHELFLQKHEALYHDCLKQMDAINELVAPVFGKKVFVRHRNSFQFDNIQECYITHTREAQLDTGKMMASLLRQIQKNGVTILNAVAVEDFSEQGTSIRVKTNQFEFNTKALLVATNGFASQLISEKVNPARAQVLVTKPIPNLSIKGTFHLDEGYYYFRNIDERILFGGGRNLDFKGEETTDLGETDRIQKQLETMLEEVILPNTPFEIDRRWSGIMGMGLQKKPIVKQLSKRVFCGVRLGGMGIAIGSLVGKELADLV